jgi:2-haloacid dehalogenase
MDFDHFDVLTFDCYGTLIDWESGILSVLRPLLEAHGWQGSDDQALEMFGALESGIQSAEFLPYREVLRRLVDKLATELGFTPTVDERNVLADSVGQWPAFPDSAAALQALGTRFRLGIVSNIDDDLFEQSNRWLGIEWDQVVTAQQVGSYKPAPGHFHEMVSRLGAGVGQVLHVAQSLYHDIAPATALGFTTVWVNRRAGREGAGATPVAEATPDLEVPDLATLARLCGV